MVSRTRFAAEFISAIRARVGADFPIILRWSQWKMQDYNAKLAPSPQALEEFLTPLIDAGVDIFHCSTRRFGRPEFDGSSLNLAGWTKKVSGRPTITVGSIGLNAGFVDEARLESNQTIMKNKKSLLHICPFFQYEPDNGLAFEPREYDWTQIEYWETIAKWAEQGRFDAIFFADFWGAARDPISIRYGKNFPMLDPLLLVSRLSAVAENLGFMVTMSTSFYNPYMVARKMQTLNHITNGRIGWNIVTSVNQKEADQLGMTLPGHDERYERAYEYVDLVKKLWASWEPDAVINDYDNYQISDPDKVHPVDFDGRWFKSAGPLAVHRNPLGDPVLVQAGSSPEGMKFAGKYAEVIFGPSGPTAVKKARVEKLRAAVSDAGRDPYAVKILFPIGGCVAQSRSEADERAAQIAASVPDEVGLNVAQGLSGFDLLSYPVNTKVSDILDQVTGVRGLFNMAADKGFTILDVARFMTNRVAEQQFVGTAADVADSIEAETEEIGCDGYMFRASYYAPHYVRDMATMLIPELQRRGRMRQSYESKTLRSYLAQEE